MLPGTVSSPCLLTYYMVFGMLCECKWGEKLKLYNGAGSLSPITVELICKIDNVISFKSTGLVSRCLEGSLFMSGIPWLSLVIPGYFHNKNS